MPRSTIERRRSPAAPHDDLDTQRRARDIGNQLEMSIAVRKAQKDIIIAVFENLVLHIFSS